VDTDTPSTRSTRSTKTKPFNKFNKERKIDDVIEDFYSTPEEYTNVMISYIEPIKEEVGGIYNDPCNGNGATSKVLDDHGWTGVLNDKYTMEKSVDMLTEFNPTGGLIFTNTPFRNKAKFLEKMVDTGLPFCALFPVASMGLEGFSRQLNRLNTLAVIVLNKRFPFKTKTGKEVGIESCAWYCWNFPEGYFDKSLYFAFSPEEGEEDDEYRPVVRSLDGGELFDGNKDF